VHDGAGHAFMNPQNPLGNLDEALAAKCWAESTAFLHDQLG
jgi:dienelactone hydrolase